MFIERTSSDQIRYGVFTYFRLPTAIPLHEEITINSINFSILLRKVSSNTIEIRGAKGSSLTLIFSTVREAISSSEAISDFVKTCCSDLPSVSETFISYLKRFLDLALTSSHGTILLCKKNPKIEDIAELKDTIPLLPVVDFYKAFSDFQIENSAGSILSLQRCEELLYGFLRCDGMIVFDTFGCITNYRVFYRPLENSSTNTGVVGGARRRAYEGVKALVGSQLNCVLFRSQDGLTLYEGGKL